MSGDAQKPNYGDFLSLEARTRARSAIKQLRPYFEIPGMISVSTETRLGVGRGKS